MSGVPATRESILENSEKKLDSIKHILALIEGELSLPLGFLTKLYREDDWSFIIRSHALVEAAVTKQLSSSLDARLTSVFQKLALSNAQTGKIVFAESMGLIDSTHKRFIRKLSEIRNFVVHDISNIVFDLKIYLNGLDANQKKAIARDLSFFASTPQSEKFWLQQTYSDPKFAIWTSTIFLLFKCISDTIRADIAQEKKKLAVKLLESIEKESESRN
jgi:hypothetical protein